MITVKTTHPKIMVSSRAFAFSERERENCLVFILCNVAAGISRRCPTAVAQVFQPNNTRVCADRKVPCPSPEGRCENSQALQRWDATRNKFEAFYIRVPNAEALGYCQTSLRDRG